MNEMLGAHPLTGSERQSSNVTSGMTVPLREAVGSEACLLERIMLFSCDSHTIRLGELRAEG